VVVDKKDRSKVTDSAEKVEISITEYVDLQVAIEKGKLENKWLTRLVQLVGGLGLAKISPVLYDLLMKGLNQ
jgi:hypothetical protein